MVYLAVDPGLRNTLGYVVAEVPLTSSKEITFFLLKAHLLNVKKFRQQLIASILWHECKIFGVREVLLEDFYFFRNKKKNKASWFIVSKMQKQISYLAGFFYGKGLLTETVPPVKWKKTLKKYGIEWIEKNHVISATGVLLGEILSRKNEISAINFKIFDQTFWNYINSDQIEVLQKQKNFFIFSKKDPH